MKEYCRFMNLKKNCCNALKDMYCAVEDECSFYKICETKDQIKEWKKNNKNKKYPEEVIE